ncbi:MAG: Fic family protein [Firmicutes bacterium]|nr:Fic family protein [Bacillota bacterium]
MRNYDLKNETKPFLDQSFIAKIAFIFESKGRADNVSAIKPEILEHLLQSAIIESTISSNRIEGINTSDNRAREILSGSAKPANRSENEILGYQKCLKKVHKEFESIPISSAEILKLHKLLFSYQESPFAGKYKTDDNVIEETDATGKKAVRFVPTSYLEAPMELELLCSAYNDSIRKKDINPLLLIPVFVLDFLCIHPFQDGNGRMSRLLTLLLLYKNGFNIGKYISIEKAVEETKEGYYQALKNSSYDWHSGNNDTAYFGQYLLEIVIYCYKEFENRTLFIQSKESKFQRIKTFIDDNIGLITKKDIKEHCPDISVTTIELTLSTLLNQGYILKKSGGRFSSYQKA